MVDVNHEITRYTVLGVVSNCETFAIGRLPIKQNNKQIVKREKRLRDINSSSEDECVQPEHCVETVNHKLLESDDGDVSEESFSLFLEKSSDSGTDEANIKET